MQTDYTEKNRKEVGRERKPPATTIQHQVLHPSTICAIQRQGTASANEALHLLTKCSIHRPGTGRWMDGWRYGNFPVAYRISSPLGPLLRD